MARVAFDEEGEEEGCEAGIEGSEMKGGAFRDQHVLVVLWCVL